MKAVIGTVLWALALCVIGLGILLAQGERDLVQSALALAGLLAAIGSVVWLWSIVDALRRRPTTALVASATSTVTLVAASLLMVIGLPMLLGFITAIRVGHDIRIAELPWVFVVGAVAFALGVGQSRTHPDY